MTPPTGDDVPAAEVALVRDPAAVRRMSAGTDHFVVIAERSSEFIGMADLAMRVFYLNDAALRLVGLDGDGRDGAPTVPDFFFPADRDRVVRDFLPRVLADGHGEMEVRFRHFRTGDPVWVIYSVFALHDAAGVPVGWATVSRDITARKAVEEDLREREARFRTLFSSIDEGYCLCEMVLDAEGRAVDYRFLEVNDKFAEFTGITDPVGRTARECVPALEDRWIRTYAGVALGGDPLRFSQGSDAMGRWFDVFAAPVPPVGRFALVFTDVTAQRRDEVAARQRAAAEREARERAELMAEVVSRLEETRGVAARGRRLAELLAGRLAERVVVEAPALGEAVVAGSIGGVDPARSVTTVPFDAGPGLRGTLRLESSDPAGLGDAAAAFAQRLAERAAVLLASERVREEESRVTRRLQEALLPGSLRSPPGVEIAARYEAGHDRLEVGGDWYDTFTFPDGRLGLVVGDVVGHGIDAAAAMGRLRTAVSALAAHARGPGEVLSHLEAFASGPDGADFTTVTCAALEVATGALDHATAGHPPPLVLLPDGTTRWLAGGRSMPLVGRSRSGRSQATERLEPGSVLVMYTDGLVERRGESITHGLDRLARTAAPLRGLPVAELCDRLLDDLRLTPAMDDVAVLCLRTVAAHSPEADGGGPQQD